MSASDHGSRRPRRDDVIEAYDLGVDGYMSVWSPVILPPAEKLVARLELPPDARIVDVGGGTGALVPAMRRASPDAGVVAVDASVEMLRANRAGTRAAPVRADAVALPFRDRAADAVVLAYVLFHLSHPEDAVAEAHRVLSPGGVVATVTWAHESHPRAVKIWDDALRAAGAAEPPVRRVDTGLDTPEGITDLLTTAGFEAPQVWREPLHHQWTVETYWRLATGAGVNRMRLAILTEEARAAALAQARDRLAEQSPADFDWSGEVICALARRPASIN